MNMPAKVTLGLDSDATKSLRSFHTTTGTCAPSMLMMTPVI